MEVWNIVTLTFKLFMKKCNLCQNRQNKPRIDHRWEIFYHLKNVRFFSFQTFDSIFDIIMLYVEISLHWSLKPVLQRTEGGRRQMSGCSCVCGERRDTRRPAPK